MEEPKRLSGESVDMLIANPSQVFLMDVLEDWAKHGRPGVRATRSRLCASMSAALNALRR